MPNGLYKVYDKAKSNTQIYQTILTSDFVLFDIGSAPSGADEVDAVVKFLKTQQLTKEQQTLIIISSVMSWQSTPPKQPLSQTESLDFTEDDYPMRHPATRFAKLKYIENLVLQLPKVCPKIKTHVVCAGVLYGNGERVLYDHLRKWWTGE